MRVSFTQFAKMRNSTAIPDSFSASYDCILLDDSSVQHAQIKVNIGQAGNPSAYNYAKIDDFNRYYFITDWTWSGRLWVATLDVDVMGTYRTNILNSTQYVTRSATGYNLKAPENRYPVLNDFTAVTKRADNSWNDEFNNGTYVVGMISSSGDGGAVSYYEMTPSTFKSLCKYLFNSDLYDLDDILGDISEALWKTMFNPFEYIVSAMWFPFSDTGGIPVSNIDFGWFSFNISARYISDPTRSIDVKTISIPKNPNYTKTGALAFEYYNVAPFAQYSLHWNPWGDIVLDPTYLIGATELTLRPQIDLTTGKGVLQIYNGTTLLEQHVAMVGVPITVAQSNTNVLSGVSGLVQGVTSGLAGGALGAVAGGVIGGTMGTLSSDGVSRVGAQGSVAGLGDGIYLTGKFRNPAELDNAHFGYPYYKKAKISSLSGYCECEGVNIVGTGASIDDVTSIKNMMEGGFYIV